MAGCKQFLLGLILLSILLPGRMQIAEVTGGSTPLGMFGDQTELGRVVGQWRAGLCRGAWTHRRRGKHCIY